MEYAYPRAPGYCCGGCNTVVPYRWVAIIASGATGVFAELNTGVLLKWTPLTSSAPRCRYSRPAQPPRSVCWVDRVQIEPDVWTEQLLYVHISYNPPNFITGIISHTTATFVGQNCNQAYGPFAPMVTTTPIFGVGTCPAIQWRRYKTIDAAVTAWPSIIVDF